MNIYIKRVENIVKVINGITFKFNIEKVQNFSVNQLNDKVIELNGDPDIYLSQIIDHVEKHLIQNIDHINCDLNLTINRLEEIRSDYFRNEWCLKNKKILDEIEDNNFLVSKKYIIYHKIIPLQYVLYKEKYYEITDKIRDRCNLNIRLVKIYIANTFKTIILCNGLHPNLDEHNKHFCLDPVLCRLDLNFRNLFLVIQSMKIANLNRCYNFAYFHHMFKEIINERSKIDEIQIKEK